MCSRLIVRYILFRLLNSVHPRSRVSFSFVHNRRSIFTIKFAVDFDWDTSHPSNKYDISYIWLHTLFDQLRDGIVCYLFFILWRGRVVHLDSSILAHLFGVTNAQRYTAKRNQTTRPPRQCSGTFRPSLKQPISPKGASVRSSILNHSINYLTDRPDFG